MVKRGRGRPPTNKKKAFFLPQIPKRKRTLSKVKSKVTDFDNSFESNYGKDLIPTSHSESSNSCFSMDHNEDLHGNIYDIPGPIPNLEAIVREFHSGRNFLIFLDDD